MKFSFNRHVLTRTLIGGAPEGQDARVLADIARQAGGAGVIHIALDDTRMAHLAEALAFFAPDIRVIQFPAWDCLPYDRVSPGADVVGERVAALMRLINSSPAGEGMILLTTVNAFLQRVSPPETFQHTAFSAKIGDRIDSDKLQQYLTRNGYNRAQTVREPGEFAIRGDIIDIFPPAAEEPLRLDLFGDELENIRAFDPLTQLTSEKRDGFTLKPMGEILLDEASIQNFRARYRELFGAQNADDPLYEAISAGRKYGGMEHWLPLFYLSLVTLADYMPHASVVLDAQVEEARNQRLEQIMDFYQARQALMKTPQAGAYKPVPPTLMFLDKAEWESILGKRATAILSPFAPAENTGIDAQGRRGHDFAEARTRMDINLFDAVRDHIAILKQQGKKVLVAGYTDGSCERLKTLLSHHGMEHLRLCDTWHEANTQHRDVTPLVTLAVEHGFVTPDLAVVAEQDILGERMARPARKKRRSANFISEVSSLSPGDLVVHAEHGIGRYEGLETLDVGGAPHDCVKLIYADGDKLFVPVENIDVLTRYGSDEGTAQLDKLGGVGWQNRKARVKKRLLDMADALLKIAAERQLRHTEIIGAPEGLYDEFCARFPWAETEDQTKSIDDVLQDLGSGRPMDRLVCGDVGFGKTEVALRAAFVMAMTGKQVAVVVPTTLLARQHSRNFSKRFAGFPLHVGQLSRLVSAKDSTQVKKGLKEGTVDIVVGTHALLAKSIEFKDLGLVIVDEEQHFGVKQKERLKELRHDVHVLTMTATPIPRTLQLALSGVRELSLITTPPVDRLAVRTTVLPYDPVVVREAIMREHFRGGQTFYVCPRLEDLPKVEEALKDLVPEVKIITAHGQMASSQLEDVMTAFDEGRYEILLSTNIVESGLDIPTANTMIIHRADLFGLAQLYQLRGRVGRGKIRGYAYLTYSPTMALSQTAQQRLHVIETLDTLGAGFQLASHDMDIRGAGNLLGEEQSGNIREVGVELYQQMLDDAVDAARAGAGGAMEDRGGWTPQINLGTPVLIPDGYVIDLNVRLSLYRRIAGLVDKTEIDAFAAELVDRFGPLPEEVDNLLNVIGIKQQCRLAGVEKVDAGPKGTVLSFRNNAFSKPEKLVAWMMQQAGTIKLRPDNKLTALRAWDSPSDRVRGVQKLLEELANTAFGC
ncbi:MAG: transcription-repair coupling factor [Pseudomonadota bacterium]|nr:transcription-repair coupling factor [Pseudomonadota bacterium]